MSYVPGTTKWGGTIGTSSGGPVTWSADYFDALTVDPDSDKDSFDAALQLAFDRWENVAAIDFVFDNSSPSTDITIGARNLVNPDDISSNAIAGLAITRSFGSTITDSDVFFATGLQWAPFGSSGSDEFSDFFAVALHEIGHAIGLKHVPDTDEIMNATIFADDLGNGDVAAAQYLYGPAEGAPLADAEQVEAPSDSVALSGDDGGGGGGGAIAAILGILALVFGFGPIGAVAAAGTLPNRDEDDDGSGEDGNAYPDLAEILPTISVTEQHVAYLGGLGGAHTGLPGCGCSACHQVQMEKEECDFFL